MKTIHLITGLTILNLACLIPTFATAQKTSTANRSLLTNAEKAFVQDAINKNNEAMALAQTALQQSKKRDVQVIASQFLNDHRAAQKKLYAIANLTDTLPYNYNTLQPIAGNGKLPGTDNLNDRRNSTVTSITDNGSNQTSTSTVTANNNATGNATVGTSGNQNQSGFRDTTSRLGVNQTYNGNISIDNANGLNNSNRTDLASASGRTTENTNPALGQNPGTTNLPTNNGATNGTITAYGTVNNSTDLPNTPNFPNKVIDTVRQTGSTAGFQNTGTNLSFPGNERYSKTTPNSTPNSNASSDYGVPSTVVNNAQTNSLNTAPYANNDINSNSVQTGRVLPTSNPAAVINSSTASMGNKDVGFNNANTNNGGNVQQSGQLAADNANGVNRRTSEVINTPGNMNNNTTTTRNATTNNNAISSNTTNTNNGGNILAGRTRNRTNTNGTNQIQSTNTTNNNVGSAGFYTAPFATNQTLNTLRNTSSDTFDTQWAVQMNNNQQAIITTYQAALRRTTNTQLKAYINTVMPLIVGHQFAIKQWQTTQH